MNDNKADDMKMFGTNLIKFAMNLRDECGLNTADYLMVEISILTSLAVSVGLPLEALLENIVLSYASSYERFSKIKKDN